MPVSPSTPRPPITCLSTQLCVILQTEFTVFASFSKPQAWLRGAVVEIVQVLLVHFFWGGLSFHHSTFSNAAVEWKGINRHHLSALQACFFFLSFLKILISFSLSTEYMYFKTSLNLCNRISMTFINQSNKTRVLRSKTGGICLISRPGYYNEHLCVCFFILLFYFSLGIRC